MRTRYSRFNTRPPKGEISLRRASRKGGVKGSQAFEVLCQKNLATLKEAVFRFGNRKETYETNLHEARLAFWQTLNSGVPAQKFRTKFFEYYKKNIKAEQLAYDHPERSAIRLDNPKRNYHNLIVDKKTSLNLHMMKQNVLTRPRLITAAEALRRKERTQERKKEATKRRLANRIAVKQKERAKYEKIELEKQEEQQHAFKKLQKVFNAAIKDPFLLPLGDTLRALAQQHISEYEKGRVNITPRLEKNRGKMLFRIAPVEGKVIKPFKLKKLNPAEYKEFIGFIDELEHYYMQPFSNFPYLQEFFLSLRKRTTESKGKIPEKFLEDIQQYVYRERSKYTRAYYRGPKGKILMAKISEPDKLGEIPF